MSQNSSDLRPIPSVILEAWPPNQRQAVGKWLNEWLKKTIDPSQVSQNQVDSLETDLSTVSSTISSVSSASTDHISDTSVHGVTGNAVGTGDFATTSVGGVVKQAVAVSDVSGSTVSVDTADADATYGTAERDLINEMKGDINTLVTNLNSVASTLNTLLANIRTSGALDT